MRGLLPSCHGGSHGKTLGPKLRARVDIVSPSVTLKAIPSSKNSLPQCVAVRSKTDCKSLSQHHKKQLRQRFTQIHSYAQIHKHVNAHDALVPGMCWRSSQAFAGHGPGFSHDFGPPLPWFHSLRSSHADMGGACDNQGPLIETPNSGFPLSSSITVVLSGDVSSSNVQMLTSRSCF